VCGSGEVLTRRARGVPSPLRPEHLAITDAHYGQTLRLLGCQRCNFVFADPGETAELHALYESLDDPGYEASRQPRSLQMRSLLERIARQAHGARTLLDVGAASGVLVQAALATGLDAWGVEPSTALAGMAESHVPGRVFAGTYPHPALSQKVFDVVTLIDVLEHVADPLALLRDARAALAPEGLLVLVTPDARSVAARLLGFRWWHYRAAHVSYFAMHHLEALAQKADLRIVHAERATWVFEVEYLAARALHYVPAYALLRWARRLSFTKRLLKRSVSLNLFDSWLVFLRRAS
jgi:2-polyprenyl-3-methyl-5-hydroxy-6-metoxy-1,4-benzoquinol methylase